MGKHTHFSAVHAVGFFFIILVMGSLWRLASAHLATSQRPYLAQLGQAMAFQY